MTDLGKTALITGASSGLGEHYARTLAEQGLDLVLVARSEDKLRALARQLNEVHSRRVEVISADLTHPGCGEKLKIATDALGLSIDLLINNAGFGTTGAFHQLDADRERQEVLLNALAVMDVTRAFLPPMIERRRGAIVNVASMAGFQPLPYMTVYAATKAFVVSFTEGLRGELRGRGVRVLCVCPGPVDTPFFEATGNPRLRSTVPKYTLMTAEDVVAQSLSALKSGKSLIVPGAGNKLVALGSRLMPRGLLTAMTARVMRR